MAGSPSHIEEPRDIRRLLQRVCRAGGLVRLQHEPFPQEVPIYAESEEQVVLGISDVLRRQWWLKPRAHPLMTLEDRGRTYEAIMEMVGHGRFEGLESCALSHPSVLKCLVLVDRDPLLLLITDGDAFPRRMADSLGKKYGLCHLDYVQGRVLPTLTAAGAREGAGGGWGSCWSTSAFGFPVVWS